MHAQILPINALISTSEVLIHLYILQINTVFMIRCTDYKGIAAVRWRDLIMGVSRP